MIKVLVFFPMKIASRATPEGLAGHGLSTTGLEGALIAKNALCWQQCFFFTHVSLHIV